MKDREIETREKLKATIHLRTIYEEHFKKIHEKQKIRLQAEMLERIRDNSDSATITRCAYRLEALDSLTSGFDLLEPQEKKLTKRLEEVKDEKQRKQKQDNFHRYNGG